MLHESRIHILNQQPERNEGAYILYWMQASQRTRVNHALEYGVRAAARLGKPLLVCFGVTDRYPDANLRHYRFMEEGLRDVARNLAARGIPFLARQTSPELGALELSADAVLVVTDGAYMRHERAWRETVAAGAACRVVEVETNVLLPVTAVSAKEEYMAATIRRKIERILPLYAVPLLEATYQAVALPGPLQGLVTSPEGIVDLFDHLAVDSRVAPVGEHYKGGEDAAQERLEAFLARGLAGFATMRNEPAYGITSHLSPYLHFGQISPLEIYLALGEIDTEDKRSFVDELIVRRELSMNFVYYNPNYDSYDAITSFARETLDEHAADARNPLYSLDTLEAAETYDPYWNAAQLEMVKTGKMAGYMRMYWGKKVLEWSPSPAEAYRRLVYLNNKYSLDGRDPNGYAGIAWCFGKHDRGWAERSIFGKVRYMNDKGLERKFKIRDYVEKVASL